ncbi:agamous-like MADS-box protein MADS9 isoform X2 [Tasmannia lanceolata]|uniref:agamous-like MADS-box protein MADS9 isoform X2 n=1 Tax=Tasmannia lanceolata TaxID=3420 RepID=UPI00406328B5
MGRGKIEIKRIENSTNRQVTYSKRKGGIVKKAKEISVLCDAQVSLVIFSSAGKMSEFCSSSTTLVKLLDGYQKTSGKKLWDAKHQHLSNEVDRIKKENDNMQIKLRHLKGEDITSLHPKELMSIEDALQNGLTGVRAKQMDFLKMLKENERAMEDENRRLNYILHQQLSMDESTREMENGHHRIGRDYSAQMPLTFRVQPIQPNLHHDK